MPCWARGLEAMKQAEKKPIPGTLRFLSMDGLSGLEELAVNRTGGGLPLKVPEEQRELARVTRERWQRHHLTELGLSQPCQGREFS